VLGLETIDHGLRISDNFALTNLAGLANLASVGGDFELAWNISMVGLGLDALDYVGGSFTVWQNTHLPQDVAVALRNQVLAGSGIGGDVNICGNLGGPPCN
jgi:hypothetical protein